LEYNCIIVGAGAAGLMAARELATNGKSVLLIEARDRIGGRIYTIHNSLFSRPVDVGAEFIHGDVPITMALLREGKIHHQEMEGEVYEVKEGKLHKTELFDQDWDQVIKALKRIKRDMPFQDFLDRQFPSERYADLREGITRFVEGYNAADARKASSFALREEWSAEDNPAQSRPTGGYGRLIDLLVKSTPPENIEVKLSSRVEVIHWGTSGTYVKTNSGTHQAEKILITVPLPVLTSGTMAFEPPLPRYTEAAGQIGMGSVIKFIFEFDEPVWQNSKDRKMPSLKFLFSDASIPTWWSRLPDPTPLLTGWLGGPSAAKASNSKDKLFDVALDSLGYLLNRSEAELKQHLKTFEIIDWRSDPFAGGAYSFATVDTPSARKILNTPVDNILYFAGEALYEGPHTGTVEAALTSGKETAQRILSD
jgi:monoamine oxidase